jgi:hypothetical protein
MSGSVDDRRVQLVWQMMSALPIRAQVEIERALHGHLRPRRDPREERVRELGALAAMLRQSGQLLDGVEHSVAEQPRSGGRPPLRRRRGLQARRRKVARSRARARENARRRRWRVIPREVYDAGRPPDAPDSRRLVERYGSRWVLVCKAADGLLPDGRYRGVGKPWRTVIFHDMGRGLLYSDRDCLHAIQRCAQALGRRPSSTDYIRWREMIVRRHPRADRDRLGLPTYDVIKERHRSWPHALSEATIRDEDLAIARRAWLPQQPLPVTPAEDTVSGRLARLDESTLTELGLTSNHRQRLIAGGAHHHPLPQAAAVARAAGGSLHWLAGQTPDLGAPPTGHVRLDSESVRERRLAVGVRDDGLRRRLKLTTAQWRATLRGERHLTLGQLILMAGLLETSADELLGPGTD